MKINSLVLFFSFFLTFWEESELGKKQKLKKAKICIFLSLLLGITPLAKYIIRNRYLLSLKKTYSLHGPRYYESDKSKILK